MVSKTCWLKPMHILQEWPLAEDKPIDYILTHIKSLHSGYGRMESPTDRSHYNFVRNNDNSDFKKLLLSALYILSYWYNIYLYTLFKQMTFIPVINFASCGLNADYDTFPKNALEVGESLYNALNVYGFAYLSNSGINDEEVEIVNNVTAQFFEAPYEEKQKFARDTNYYGYVGPHAEHVNPAKPFDYKEGFMVSGTSLDDPDTKWPNNLSPEFHYTIKKTMEKCRLLALRILKVLGIGMKLADTDYFVKNHSLMNKSGNLTTLKTLYYSPLPKEQQINQIRLGEHSDYGTITLLFQDKVGGLQVQNLDGEYVDAVPIDGTILINIGDMLQFWSQNRLKSTKHRVIYSQDPEKQQSTRRSLVFFVIPDNDVLIDEELLFENEKIQNTREKSNKSGMTVYDYNMKKMKQISDYV